MADCNKCLSIGDMGSCQDFKSGHYGEDVTEKEGCDNFARDVKK